MKKTKFLFDVFVAALLVSIGITFLLKSGLGSDSFSVFIEGISTRVNMKFGLTSILVSLLFLTVFYKYSKYLLGIGTFVHFFSVGLLIDFFGKIIQSENNAIVFNVFLSILGSLLIGVGSGMFIKTKKGLGVLDVIVSTFSNIAKIKIGYSRIIVDIFFTSLGFLLGGQVGIGTVISTLTVGLFLNLYTTSF